jgi:hypothetical protein
MKKYSYIACVLALSHALGACINDKGNYTYLSEEEVMPVRISNIETSYNILAARSLVLTPVVEGIDNEDDYEYLWYIYGTGLSRSGWKDTIGREKTLDYRASIPSGTYQITYRVKNKNTGLCAYFRTDVRVTAEFSRGWFITKEQDNVTDLDLITPDGQVVPDLLRSINGSGVPGRAIKSTYVPYGYNYVQTNPDGTVTLFENQQILFVITESDFHVVSGETLERYATFDESFYELPAVKKPRDVVVGYMCVQLLNDGKLHEMPVLYANAARFGNPLLGSTSVAPYFFRHTARGNLLFDQDSRSLKVSVFWQPSLQALADTETSLISCNNMEYDLIFMQEQAAFYTLTRQGLALFKHRTTGKYYGAMLNADWMNEFKNPIASFVEVPAECQGITRATVRAVNNINDVIYYSDGGNTVGMYNLSNGVEKPVILAFDEGESVASLEHVSYYASSTATASPDCLVVLTNKAGGWKLYLYPFEGYTSDVTGTPDEIHAGQGTARDVFYRADNSPATN